MYTEAVVTKKVGQISEFKSIGTCLMCHLSLLLLTAQTSTVHEAKPDIIRTLTLDPLCWFRSCVSSFSSIWNNIPARPSCHKTHSRLCRAARPVWRGFLASARPTSSSDPLLHLTMERSTPCNMYLCVWALVENLNMLHQLVLSISSL